MPRFIDIEENYINVEKIQSFSVHKGNELHIEYDNGDLDVYPLNEHSNYVRRLTGLNESSIIQILPCHVPLFNVWKNEDGSHKVERNHFILLCADGTIQGTTFSQGLLEPVNNWCSNYLGLHQGG